MSLIVNLLGNRLEIADPHNAERRMYLSFIQTIRVGDGWSKNKLPPNLGAFPLVQIAGDVAKKMGPEHAARGGVALPVGPADAMWMLFEGFTGERRPKAWPFAMSISAGMRSAITGKPHEKDGLRERDYAVAPDQPYLDGFVTEDGTVRQFVAAPRGSGVSVEEQLTGESKFGGVQITFYPMREDVYESRFPRRPPPSYGGTLRGGPMRSRSAGGDTFSARSMDGYDDDGYETKTSGRRLTTASVATMGLGAGGEIEQQLFADPYGFDCWDLSSGVKLFVTLLHRDAWQYVTGRAAPPSRATAEVYQQYKQPFYSYYVEGAATLGGDGDNQLAQVKSVAQIQGEGGPAILPYNAPTEPSVVHVIPAKPQGNVPPSNF